MQGSNITRCNAGLSDGLNSSLGARDRSSLSFNRAAWDSDVAFRFLAINYPRKPTLLGR